MHLEVRWRDASLLRRTGCAQCERNQVRIRHLTSWPYASILQEKPKRCHPLVRARSMLALTWRRNGYLPQSVSESAWILMLALYCDWDFHEAHSVSHLAMAAGLTDEDAVRWVLWLEQQGLLDLDRGQGPAQVESVRLSTAGQAAFDSIFAD